jgi:hypothetical protein
MIMRNRGATIVFSNTRLSCEVMNLASTPCNLKCMPCADLKVPSWVFCIYGECCRDNLPMSNHWKKPSEKHPTLLTKPTKKLNWPSQPIMCYQTVPQLLQKKCTTSLIILSYVDDIRYQICKYLLTIPWLVPETWFTSYTHTNINVSSTRNSKVLGAFTK